jgi:hypothetical protein
MLKLLLYIAQRLAVAGFFTCAELGLAGLLGAPQVATLYARLTAYVLTFLFLLTIPDPSKTVSDSKKLP